MDILGNLFMYHLLKLEEWANPMFAIASRTKIDQSTVSIVSFI